MDYSAQKHPQDGLRWRSAMSGSMAKMVVFVVIASAVTLGALFVASLLNGTAG